jgi:hypothetical protein
MQLQFQNFQKYGCFVLELDVSRKTLKNEAKSYHKFTA